MIRDTFPENPELMLEIAKAESNLLTTAYNPEWHNGCQGSFGIMQVACVNYQGNPEDLFDPEINIKVARQVYERQGIMAWGVCVDKVICK